MERNFPYETVATNSIPILYTKIRSLHQECHICPKCKGILQNSFTYIPISASECAKIPAKHCLECHTDYVSGKAVKWVKRIFETNICAAKFSLDGQPARKLYDDRKNKDKLTKAAARNKSLNEKVNKLKSISGAAVMIIVSENGVSKEIIITSDKMAEAPRENIYHYSSDFAREVLTASYRPEKNKRGEINGRSFLVESNIYPVQPSKSIDRRIPDFIGEYVTLVKGGGFYSQITDNFSHIVDILLYSPFTGRYEIIRGTQYKNLQVFTDPCLFRNFIKKYGNPGVWIETESSHGSRPDFDEFNLESILHMYGYTVAQSEGLSSETRRELLTELVDLQILSVRHIVSLLNMFITMHNRPEYEFARYKWEADRDFIQKYKANPERFLIAKN